MPKKRQEESARMAMLRKRGARPVSEVRREAFFSPLAVIFRLAIVVGTGLLYAAAVLACGGMLLGLDTSLEGQNEVINLVRIELYAGLVIVPVGNILYWIWDWMSYPV